LLLKTKQRPWGRKKIRNRVLTHSLWIQLLQSRENVGISPIGLQIHSPQLKMCDTHSVEMILGIMNFDSFLGLQYAVQSSLLTRAVASLCSSLSATWSQRETAKLHRGLCC
jgi:hypothetical protein